jgi:hypothetical protein
MSEMRTWSISVTPWGQRAVTVRLVETSFTKHGRQKFECISEGHWPAGAVSEALDVVAVQVLELLAAYYGRQLPELDTPGGKVQS